MFKSNSFQSEGRCLSKDFISIGDRIYHEWEKMNKILAVLVLIISLMGCVAALDGQSGTEMRPGETAFEQLFNQGIGQPWIGGNPPGFQGEDQGISTGTSGDIFSKYSQFYSMSKGNAQKKHIEAPTKYDINEIPTTIYFSSQMQAVPYSQYQTCSTNMGGNSLWIQGSTSWTQYATIPQGASLFLLATTLSGGNGYLYEITPDGQLIKNYYSFFPGSNQINFYADTVGQHILLFAIGDQVSNAIVIDVAVYQAPIYYQQPTYQSPIYNQPFDYTPSDHQQSRYQPPGHQKDVKLHK